MKKIRYKDEPVKIFGVPHFDKTKKLQRLPYEMAKSYEVIRKTYKNALDRGEEVYFIDGETFFGDKDRHCCTTDTTHPNDLGSYRMAEVLEPVIRGILENNMCYFNNQTDI